MHLKLHSAVLRIVFLLVWVSSNMLTAAGQERVFFDTPLMTPAANHRQNFCDRYDEFRNGSMTLPDALEGMQLNVIVGAYGGAYFNYDDEKGIDPQYAGLAATILDELARRGKFTWRDSFAIYKDPSPFNATWTEMLVWGIDNYDLMVDWWGQNLERKKLGVAYLEGWFDSSLVLIGKGRGKEDKPKISFWNWLRPYDARVWLMTIFTVLLSGLVYQLLEWQADEREDRSAWDWWLENFYLSALNSTQAYEYEPKTLAARVYGVSMAIWALVMTATYTANLASLLVDSRGAPRGPQNLEEAVAFGHSICVWEGTFSDSHIRKTYRSAIRIQKRSILEMYEGLRKGECDFLVDSVSSWNGLKAQKEYNPQCNMELIGGNKIMEASAGFVLKADAGHLCTGFIRDVLDIHMIDMIEDGFLEGVWEDEHKIAGDHDCNAYHAGLMNAEKVPNEDDGSRRRLVNNGHAGSSAFTTRTRSLRAAAAASAGGAVAAATDSKVQADELRLTPEMMIGTFAFHWIMMAIALFIAGASSLYTRFRSRGAKHLSFADPRKPSIGYQPNGKVEPKEGSCSPTLGFESARFSEKDDILDLQRQMNEMQRHLQQFEKTMLAEVRKGLEQQQQQAQQASQPQQQIAPKAVEHIPLPRPPPPFTNAVVADLRNETQQLQPQQHHPHPYPHPQEQAPPHRSLKAKTIVPHRRLNGWVADLQNEMQQQPQTQSPPPKRQSQPPAKRHSPVLQIESRRHSMPAQMKRPTTTAQQKKKGSSHHRRETLKSQSEKPPSEGELKRKSSSRHRREILKSQSARIPVHINK